MCSHATDMLQQDKIGLSLESAETILPATLKPPGYEAYQNA
jgi:hypothetical protein